MKTTTALEMKVKLEQEAKNVRQLLHTLNNMPAFSGYRTTINEAIASFTEIYRIATQALGDIINRQQSVVIMQDPKTNALTILTQPILTDQLKPELDKIIEALELARLAGHPGGK